VTATLERDVAPGTQFAAYDAAERHVVWQFKRVKGGGEHSLRIAISLREERSADARKACGPVHLGFTVPGLNASRVQVRYLQIDPSGDATRRRASANRTGGKGEGPHRWVRYVTKSSNFVARV
jgi:AP-4 complex subunit mu-1